MCSEAIPGLYERHASAFDRDRGRSLQEQPWLDRFLSYVLPSGGLLDVGCGMGEPIARYLLGAGFQVLGIDSSPSLVHMCRTRFPASDWLVADMRHLALGRRFHGLLAWDSFFHLNMGDQRTMFPRFAAHALPGAPFLFTTGSARGETVSSFCGEQLYHASLDPAEYQQLLSTSGFSVLAHVANDPACGEHTVWLARYEGTSRDVA